MIHRLRSAGRSALGPLAIALLCAACSGKNSEPEAADQPFQSLEVVSSSSDSGGAFVHPLAAVPLDASRTVFLAFRPDEADEHLVPALFLVDDGELSLLHSGDLAQPVDVVFDGERLLVADVAGGEGGGLQTFSEDGSPGELLAQGFAPVSLAVDDQSQVYFSGRDPESGDLGVFRLTKRGDVEPLYVGAPLVDPSGIAPLSDGRVLIADTSFAGEQSAVLLLSEGELSVFASNLRSGFPAGIALNAAEDALIVSAEDDAHHDVVNVIGIARSKNGSLVARGGQQVSSVFSDVSDSSGGLHPELQNPRHLTWCSTSKDDGTIYRVETF
jgi:hypothetical protein